MVYIDRLPFSEDHVAARHRYDPNKNGMKGSYTRPVYRYDYGSIPSAMRQELQKPTAGEKCDVDLREYGHTVVYLSTTTPSGRIRLPLHIQERVDEARVSVRRAEERGEEPSSRDKAWAEDPKTALEYYENHRRTTCR